YQKGLGLSMRGTPDVSYDANPNTGFAVYDSVGSGGWGQVGGTHARAPPRGGPVSNFDQGPAPAGKGAPAHGPNRLYFPSPRRFPRSCLREQRVCSKEWL